MHIQVYGIKGASVFLLHPAFNMAKGFVIDDLHAVYLGVTVLPMLCDFIYCTILVPNQIIGIFVLTHIII